MPSHPFPFQFVYFKNLLYDNFTNFCYAYKYSFFNLEPWCDNYYYKNVGGYKFSEKKNTVDQIYHLCYEIKKTSDMLFKIPHSYVHISIQRYN